MFLCFLKFLFIYFLQQVLISYLFMHISVYMSIPISQFIPSPRQHHVFEIHTYCNVSQCFVPLYGRITFHCADGHVLSIPQLMCIRAAVNTRVQVLMWTPVFPFLGNVSGSGISGPRGPSVLYHLRSCPSWWWSVTLSLLTPGGLEALLPDPARTPGWSRKCTRGTQSLWPFLGRAWS